MTRKQAIRHAVRQMGPRGVARRERGECIVGYARDALTVEVHGRGKTWLMAFRDACGDQPEGVPVHRRKSTKKRND